MELESGLGNMEQGMGNREQGIGNRKRGIVNREDLVINLINEINQQNVLLFKSGNKLFLGLQILILHMYSLALRNKDARKQNYETRRVDYL